MSGRSYGPAVVDGKLVYTSVSAINKFVGCKRQWWFRYVARLPDEAPTRAMDFGVKAHGRIEHYLKKGENLLGPAERAAFDKGLIPAPGADLLVEAKIHEGIPLTAASVPLKGGLDLANPRARGRVQVTDWKLKSNIARYKTTPERLVDPEDEDGRQMLGYAEWVRANAALFPGLREIEVRHVHMNTGGIDERGEPKGPFDAREYTSVRFGLESVRDLWHIVESKFVEPMKVASRAKRANDVEPNPKVCFKYGRPCPYLDRCQQDGDQQALNALFQEEETVGLLSNIQKPEAAVIAPVVAVEAPKPQEKPLRIWNVGAPYRYINGAAVILLSLGRANDAHVRFMDGRGLEADVPLNALGEELAAVQPPDAPPSDPKLAADPLPTPTVPAPTPSPVAEETKRGRGRPKRASAEPASTSVVSAPVETASPSAKAPEAPEPVPFPEMGIELYFDGAFPLGQPTKTLHAYVDGLERRIIERLAAEGTKIVDIRVAKGEDLGFGKWKGFLAKLALQSRPEAGAYLVTRGDERIETVAQALIEVADRVVMGSGR